MTGHRDTETRSEVGREKKRHHGECQCLCVSVTRHQWKLLARVD